MQRDEEGTLSKLDLARASIDPLISQHKGRLFNTGGDSILVEFASAVDAVKFGIAMQTRMAALKDGLRWRVGLHVGEVWIYGTNLMGDAVNLAARCESLADYGGVTMTDAVYKLVLSKMKNVEFVSRGEQEFKNVAAMEIWSVVLPTAEPNPNLSKRARAATETTTKSHAELIAAVVNDQAARNRTLHDAQMFRREHKFGPATRILMWRITKNDRDALDELISMGMKDLIPADLKNYVASVLREYCMKIDSDRALRVADLLESRTMNYPAIAVQFVKIAARVNEEASYRYAMMVFNDPTSSEKEIESVLGDLQESAMRRRVPAMMQLGEYYTKIGDKKNAFRWLYAARSEHNVAAQKLLEDLNKTITKAEFNNFKTDADALVDQIKFIDDNRMR
jgi:hypothetical protein